VIVDASVLVAAINRSDPHSGRCQAAIRGERRLVVPAPALAEAAYLVQKRLGPHLEIKLIESLTIGPWVVEAPSAVDLMRVVALMKQYVDLPLGFSDAVSIAIAERLEDPTVASLDAHFRVVRPAHVEAFDVRP
jgi:uncharacterized protein